MGHHYLFHRVVSFRARLSDPVDPVPGPSHNGNSVLRFLRQLMGDSSSSPPFAVGADGVCLGDGVSSSGVQFGAPPSLSGRLPGFSSGVHLPPPSSSAPVPPLAPPVAHFAPPVVQLAPVTSFAPPGFPLAPPVGFCPPITSLAPPVTLLPFPISSLLSSAVSSPPPLAPSYPSSSVVSRFEAPVPSSGFPVVSSCASSTVISWALPTVVTCASPSVASLVTPVHSFVSPVVSLGSSAL